MEHRIAELERTLQWMKVALALVVVLLSGLVFTAFRSGQQEDVLRVRGLVVTDEVGRDRILIGAPVPASESRVRTDSDKARAAWAGRFPNPDQYMKYYRDYSHATNGIVVLSEDGFDRLVVGDPVPDPNIGKRIGPSTGLVINDAEGFERSGYGLLDVEGEKRVVLGLDSGGGTEGLALFLFDNGVVGMSVEGEPYSLFLGSAPAGALPGGGQEPFSGLAFSQGQEVVRAITGGGQ